MQRPEIRHHRLRASPHLAAILKLVQDLFLYRFQVVFHSVLWKEIIGAPGFVWSVSRRLPEGSRKLHEVNTACV